MTSFISSLTIRLTPPKSTLSAARSTIRLRATRHHSIMLNNRSFFSPTPSFSTTATSHQSKQLFMGMHESSSSSFSSTVEADRDSELHKRGYRYGDRVLLFDGVCVLCNGGVDFILKNDPSGQLKFAALQSDIGLKLLDKFNAPTDLSTVVFIDGNSAYTRSDAVFKVAQYMRWYYAIPSQIALFAVPKFIRDYMYSDLLAKNRYNLFGKRDECRLVDPQNKSRFLM